jgi:GTP cyclohydrolase I
MSLNKEEQIEIIGDAHIMTSIETPLKKDAFEKSDDDKIILIEGHFREIMEVLGLDLNDDSLSGTPKRVAKMYVKELFSGLHPNNKPKLSVFANKYEYNRVLIEKNITFYSACEHHFLPIIGKAHVGYLAKDKVIGLSTINRIVEYYAKRPQVQERLTLQIAKELRDTLGTDDVIVIIDAEHLCVSSRGVKDQTSSTVTIEYSGVFEDVDKRNEFMKLI